LHFNCQIFSIRIFGILTAVVERIVSPVILRRIICYMLTDFSERHATYIFRVLTKLWVPPKRQHIFTIDISKKTLSFILCWLSGGFCLHPRMTKSRHMRWAGHVDMRNAHFLSDMPWSMKLVLTYHVCCILIVAYLTPR
jgi:hypothetical protein